MTLFNTPLPKSWSADAEVDLAQWVDRGILLAVVLASGVALSLNVADPDLWGHVQYGQDALAQGLARTTTYSYVAEGYPWINHEILAEYVLAIGAASLGGSGLLLGKCLLGIAISAAILWRAMRQGAGLIASCGITLLVAVTLGSHWSLRPQIASYVSFAMLLGLLSFCFAGWEGSWQLACTLTRRASEDDRPSKPSYSITRLKFLWLAVPLFALWTNAHGGFLAGLCVFIAYLTLRGLEAYSQMGCAARGLLLRLGLMAGAAILATLLNPYGPLFHGWLYHDLSLPRPEIVEWRPPEFLNSQFFAFWLLTAVSIASLVRSQRPRDFTQLVILGLILWQALSHQRHIAFLALACGWWLPPHVGSLLQRLGVGSRFQTDEEHRYGWAPPQSTALAAAFSPRTQQIFATILVLAICISAGQITFRCSSLNVDRQTYPVDAFQYIARQGLTGKMVCTFNWAQYALAAFGPRQPGQPGILVQIDGRCRTSYPQELLDMHFDFILGQLDPTLRYRSPSSAPFDPERVLSHGEPDLVLISRLQEPSVKVMEGQEGRWILLYQDQLAQLWGRAAKYDDPQSADYLPKINREVGSFAPRGIVRWPALPEYRPGPDRQRSLSQLADSGSAGQAVP